MVFWDTFKFSIVEVIDLLLVAFLLYYLYKLVKGTVAINIFTGIVIIYLIFKLTQALQMPLLSGILGGFINVGMFALIVVFQQEIRKFLLMLGSSNFGRRRRFLKQLRFLKSDTKNETNIHALVDACEQMATTKTGALIVIERNNDLDFLIAHDHRTSITLSSSIIQSIFFKNSPLHDGAIIIKKNSIKATRIALPVTEQANVPQRFGLRHRAAIGITEKTDALAIVVSEERGELSYARDGAFISFNDKEELLKCLESDLN